MLSGRDALLFICEAVCRCCEKATSDESSELPRQENPLCAAPARMTEMILYHHGNSQYTSIPQEARAALRGAVVQAWWE